MGDLFYVWYVRGDIPKSNEAAIWCAVSANGHAWTELGEVLTCGPQGSWDAKSVSGPNILVAEKRYWLFYSGMAESRVRMCSKMPESAIGVAVADSPNGPWTKSSVNPVFRARGAAWYFGDVQTRNPCPIIREGEYWLYYERNQSGIASIPASVGVTVAKKPEGPYRDSREPLIRGGGGLMVWPLDAGVAAWINTGSPGTAKTLRYAANGFGFSRMQNVDEIPTAAGAYRPEAFTNSGEGRMIEWGLHTRFSDGSLPFIERFDCRWQ